MKINELLMNVYNKEFNLERGLQVKKYLPIEVKKTIAQGIIFECTDEENGAIKVDSVQRYLSYVRYMITMHTNLEYTDEDYDTICSNVYGETSLLNAIVSCFQGDANECNRILDLMMDDYLENNSASNQIISSVTGFVNSLNILVKGLESKVSDMKIEELVPNDLDLNKLSEFLNSYKK